MHFITPTHETLYLHPQLRPAAFSVSVQTHTSMHVHVLVSRVCDCLDMFAFLSPLCYISVETSRDTKRVNGAIADVQEGSILCMQHHSSRPSFLHPAFTFKCSLLARWEQDIYGILSTLYPLPLSLSVSLSVLRIFHGFYYTPTVLISSLHHDQTS